jgi:hypothetical protein
MAEAAAEQLMEERGILNTQCRRPGAAGCNNDGSTKQKEKRVAACKTDGKATLKPEKRSTDQVRMALVAHLASQSQAALA